MLAVKGIYEDGTITLCEMVSVKEKVNVVVTFLEDLENENKSTLKCADFGFEASRILLKNVKTSFSDTLIEERRAAL